MTETDNKAVQPKAASVEMLVDQDWLSRHVATDPDVDVEARPAERCHADRDGDCWHKNCPQLRDNEPETTGRHCPIDTYGELEEDGGR